MRLRDLEAFIELTPLEGNTMRHCNKPRGLFQGKNFMTPDVRGYYKLREGYAELSEGTGISHQPIFGVTVKPEDIANPRSKMFHSLTEAREYIESLS